VDTLSTISAIFTFGGFLAATYLVSWQFRIHPRDRQEWAAMAFFIALSVMLALISWSNTGGPRVGSSLHGTLIYLGVMASLIWLAVETRVINAPKWKKNKETQAREEDSWLP
jgi:4-amino-4-deoxy-L-arabinose transferase-like glycosyltransferase